MPNVWRSDARLLLAVLLLLATMASARAQPICKGVDMLAELAASDPAAHARLTTSAAQTKNTEAMLWRIEKRGSRPSHLLGTAHLSDDRLLKLSPRVREAIATSRVVALEVADLTPRSMDAAVAKSANLFVYTDGQQLDRHLGATDFAKASGVLAKAGIPVAAATRIRPWLVFLMLAMPDCERRRQAGGKPALDQALAAEAKKRKVPVIGLETIESQLAMMADLPETQQIAMLRAVLFHVERTEDQMETMLQLYLNRRMGLAIPFQHELARRAGIAPEQYDAFERTILVKRNHGMAAAARPLLDKGAAFVAVGALHLVGAEGLIELLRRAGYTVTAVE